MLTAACSTEFSDRFTTQPCRAAKPVEVDSDRWASGASGQVASLTIALLGLNRDA